VTGGKSYRVGKLQKGVRLLILTFGEFEPRLKWVHRGDLGSLDSFLVMHVHP
jgi:hypothetical protein